MNLGKHKKEWDLIQLEEARGIPIGTPEAIPVEMPVREEEEVDQPTPIELPKRKGA